MTTVVKSSSSVYSTYISTVDHLPCDIVRSLWLVQACNVAADTERQKLHEYLQEHPYTSLHTSPKMSEVAKVYQESQRRIRRWTREALAELENLDTQMRAHGEMLRRGVEQLRQAASAPPMPDQQARSELLKSQLDAHYRENPLASQVEALQERVLKGSRNVIIKHVPGQGSGVKIILKLPKNSILASRSASGRVEGFESASLAKSGAASTSQGSQKVLSPIRKRKTRGAELSAALEEQGREAEEKAPKLKPQPKATTVSNTQAKSSTLVLKPPSSAVPAAVDESDALKRYCFCNQPSFGDMIACDHMKCPNGEWFHYKCVNLSRAEATKYKTQKWYCSDQCREGAQKHKPRKKRRRGKW
ncbi:hypothetical protein OXX69_010948 [Metschnikowia pulcherrima]